MGDGGCVDGGRGEGAGDEEDGGFCWGGHGWDLEFVWLMDVESVVDDGVCFGGCRDLIYSASLLLCCFVIPERFVLNCLEGGGVVACVMSSSVNGRPRNLFDASDTPKPSHADASKPRPGRR